MTERKSARSGWLRAGALSCCIAATAVAVASCANAHRAADRASAVRIRMLPVRDQFTACEQRIERAAGRVPVMAIVGASYTDGVGPDNPALSWAADLARNLRWNAAIDGVPGAGYVRTGSGALGPMTRLVSAERLPELSPALVIVQAGNDDGTVPAGIERQQVRRTIERIRAEAPHARIGLVTVFTSPARPIPARFYRIDSAIVAGARAADPNAIIMDPLTGQWKYQHAHEGLHPTAAGDAWVARKVGAILRAHGIVSRPATTSGAAPITCDLGVRAGGLDFDASA